MSQENPKNALSRLDELKVPTGTESLETESQRIVAETSHLSAETSNHFYDQRSYDSYRQGLVLREAVEAAMHEGRTDPDDTDLLNARENIQLGINRQTVNAGALERRLTKVALAHGQDFDPNAPLGQLELNTADDLNALLAGIYSAGDMYLSSQRKAIIAGEQVSEDRGSLKGVYDALAYAGSYEELERAIMSIPSVAGLRKAVYELAANLKEESVDFKNPFSKIDDVRNDSYFNQVVEVKAAHALSEAEQAVGSAFDDSEGLPDPSISAAKGIIGEQIEQLNQGKGSVHVVAMHPEIPEAPERHEASSPEQIMVDACASPDLLIRALEDPETPQQLKSAVNELVQAHREALMAGATSDIWEQSVKPILERIKSDGSLEVTKALDQAIDNLRESKSVIQNMHNTIEDAAQRGDVDYLHRQFALAKIAASSVSNDLRSGKYKQPLAEVSQDQRVMAFRTTFANEDIVALQDKLKTSFGQATPEELEALYSMHASEMVAGPDSILALSGEIRASTKHERPGWSHRRESISQIFTSLSKIANSAEVSDRTTEETALANELDTVDGNITKILNSLQEHGIGPKTATGMREALGRALGKYQAVFNSLDEVATLRRTVDALIRQIQ